MHARTCNTHRCARTHPHNMQYIFAVSHRWGCQQPEYPTFEPYTLPKVTTNHSHRKRKEKIIVHALWRMTKCQLQLKLSSYVAVVVAAATQYFSSSCYASACCNLFSSASWWKLPERKTRSFRVSMQFEHCMSASRNLVRR